METLPLVVYICIFSESINQKASVLLEELQYMTVVINVVNFLVSLLIFIMATIGSCLKNKKDLYFSGCLKKFIFVNLGLFDVGILVNCALGYRYMMIIFNKLFKMQ
jgi:hypothetical protein